MEKLSKIKNFNNHHSKPICLAHIKHENYDTTVAYKINETEKGLLLDFIQTVTTDNNKWQEPNIVSDKILYRYIFNDKINKTELINFIETNYTQEKLMMQETFDFTPIANLAQDTKYLQVSLPYGFKSPENPHQRHKDTFRPVKVIMNDDDCSYAFDDYDQFGSKIVNKVYDSIIKNKVPELNNVFFENQKMREQSLQEFENSLEELCHQTTYDSYDEKDFEAQLQGLAEDKKILAERHKHFRVTQKDLDVTFKSFEKN